jgi:carbon starvation protein
MAKIFAELPLVRALPRALAYWYHFAIMFEGLFILTTVDAGTRVARFLLQEVLSRSTFEPLRRRGQANDFLGTIAASLTVVAAWSWLIFEALGNPRGMGVLWTMLGVSNQLLAVIALTFGSAWLVNQGKRRYVWVTLVPLLWVAATTLTGGYASVTQNYLQMVLKPETRAMGIVCAAGVSTVMLCASTVVVLGALRVFAPRRGQGTHQQASL